MELIKSKYYRVTTLRHVSQNEIVDLPISAGLTVEEYLSDIDGYMIVGKVRWNAVRDCPEYEDCMFRTFETIDISDRLQIDDFINAVYFAKQALTDYVQAEGENR